MPRPRTQQKRGRTGRTTSAPRRTSGRRAPAKRSSPRQTGGRPTRGRQAKRSFVPDDAKIEDLVLQALETELGGVQVYETAIRCARNDDLKEEWQEYLDHTKNHVEVVQELCQKLGIDRDKQTPGRQLVHVHGQTLVQAMERALETGDFAFAETVAAEMVVQAEVKDHANWELIGLLGDALDDERGQAFQEAHDEVEDEEDEHLYHTMGWARELWLKDLGFDAELPPPEEEKDVSSMAEAARAKTERQRALKAAR